MSNLLQIFLFGNFTPMEILLIAVVVLLIFGAKKLPEIGRAFGNGLREFRKATSEIANSVNQTDTNAKQNNPTDTKQIDNPYNFSESSSPSQSTSKIDKTIPPIG